MAPQYDPAQLGQQLDVIEQVAIALAKSHGLDFAERCPLETDPTSNCDSSTCVAAYNEDHDPSLCRDQYRKDARVALGAAGAAGLTGVATAITVLQPWVSALTMMQQTVLLTAVRGPDGVPKYGPTKMLLRWYRRCILLSAMDRAILPDPLCEGGGSFTGPSVSLIELQAKAVDRAVARADVDASLRWGLALPEAVADQMNEDGWEPLLHEVVGSYLRELDAIPHHFQLHLLHAAQIVGYKHPDRRVRGWWLQTYERLVHDMHLWPETEAQMDLRLSDRRDTWLDRNDPATVM